MHVSNGHWPILLCLTLVLHDSVFGLNDFSHRHSGLDRLQPVHDQQVPRGAGQGAGRRGSVGYDDVNCRAGDTVLWCYCSCWPVYSILLHCHAYAIHGNGGFPSCNGGIDLLPDPVARIAIAHRTQDRPSRRPNSMGAGRWSLLGGILYEGDGEANEMVGSLDGDTPTDGCAFPTRRVDCWWPRHPAS